VRGCIQTHSRCVVVCVLWHRIASTQLPSGTLVSKPTMASCRLGSGILRMVLRQLLRIPSIGGILRDWKGRRSLLLRILRSDVRVPERVCGLRRGLGLSSICLMLSKMVVVSRSILVRSCTFWLGWDQTPIGSLRVWSTTRGRCL
jgi:hypothetical protein